MNHSDTLNLLCSLEEAFNQNSLVLQLSEFHQNLVHRAVLKLFHQLNLNGIDHFKLVEINAIGQIDVELTVSCQLLNKPYLFHIHFNQLGDIQIFNKAKNNELATCA